MSNTLSKLLIVRAVLARLIELDNTSRIDVDWSTTLDISTISARVNKELEPFDKTRDRVIKELGTKNAAGDYEINHGTEAHSKFSAALEELAGKETSLVFAPIPAAKFERAKLPISLINSMFAVGLIS